MARGRPGLKEALEALFGRPVDLVEAGAVRNPYLKARIAGWRESVLKRSGRRLGGGACDQARHDFAWQYRAAPSRGSDPLRA